MRKITVIVVCMFLALAVQAQRKNAIYIEGAGNGILYSVNYERHFSDECSGWGMRVGGMRFRRNSNAIFVAPVQLHYIFGSTHALEVGAGATLFQDDTTQFYPSTALVYRYQSSYGLLIRAGIGGTYSIPEKGEAYHIPPALFYFYPAVSVGYRF